MAKGLCALQRHHLLHRDIKPGNVIYVGGCPVLSDPGLIVEESDSASLVGTPGYVPPENFTDAASDIYSLGLTLKAASFGRQVEDLDKGPSLESDIGAAFFPVWWRILNKATDPTPSRRYQSAKALLKDVIGLRHRIAIASIAGSRVSKAAIALFAIAAVAAFAFTTVSNRRERSKFAERNAELESLKQFKTDQETKEEKAIREAQEQAKKIYREMRDESWNSYDTGDRHAKERIEQARQKVEKIKRFADNIKRDIAEIEMVDKAKAEQLQGNFDKIVELDAKIEVLCQKFEELRKNAKEKLKKGLDDKEEYLQAQKITRIKKGKETISLLIDMYYELEKLVDRTLPNNRHQFLYDVRHKWERYYGKRGCGKLVSREDIGRIAAVDKEKAKELQSLLDRFNELEAKQHLIRVELRKVSDVGKAKAYEGLDDMAEFRQAGKIYERECRLFDAEIKPIAEELNAKWKKYAEDLIDDI